MMNTRAAWQSFTKTWASQFEPQQCPEVTIESLLLHLLYLFAGKSKT